MKKERLSNMPISPKIHRVFVRVARERGMTIRALHERVLTGWLDDVKATAKETTQETKGESYARV